MDDIYGENDETILLKNVERIEEVIIEGILSIRKSCSRPSYITMLSYVNNGEEFNLNMQSLKRIMKDMMDMGTIHVAKGDKSHFMSQINVAMNLIFQKIVKNWMTSPTF